MNFHETISTQNTNNLFRDKGLHYKHLNYYELFFLYFNAIPNFISEQNIDCEKANINFFEKYKSEIKEHFYSKQAFENETESKLKEVYYLLDGVFIIFEIENNYVEFLFLEKNISKVEYIITEVTKLK